jgi:hypothetical protein
VWITAARPVRPSRARPGGEGFGPDSGPLRPKPAVIARYSSCCAITSGERPGTVHATARRWQQVIRIDRGGPRAEHVAGFAVPDRCPGSAVTRLRYPGTPRATRSSGCRRGEQPGTLRAPRRTGVGRRSPPACPSWAVLVVVTRRRVDRTRCPPRALTGPEASGGVRRVETHLPAEQPPPGEEARLPRSHEHPRRSIHRPQPAPARAYQARGLTAVAAATIERLRDGRDIVAALRARPKRAGAWPSCTSAGTRTDPRSVSPSWPPARWVGRSGAIGPNGCCAKQPAEWPGSRGWTWCWWRVVPPLRAISKPCRPSSMRSPRGWA